MRNKNNTLSSPGGARCAIAQITPHKRSAVWDIRWCATLLLVAAALTASAQRERTRTVTATGSYVANQNETPAYGQAQALQEAKKQALREAGVMENISSTAIIVMGNADDGFREISSELSRIELEGRVRVKQQTDATPMFAGDNLVKYTTTIVAEVVTEETEEDLTFQLVTKGFKNTYHSGEKMTFTVTPTANCHLRIFLFGQQPQSNAQIYPMEGIFKDVPLKADETVAFPPEERRFLYNTPFDYTPELDNPRNDIEQDVILVVALKKPYPFVGEVSYENVIRWLSKIKRNEKRVLWQGVNIIRN